MRSSQVIEQPVDVTTTSLAAVGLQTLSLRVANAACAALVSILVARLLGPAGKGLYSLPAIDAALMTTLFAGLSIGTSYYLLRRHSGRGALRAAGATSVIFVVIGVFGVVAIAAATKQLWAALPAALSLPASAALMVANGYCYGISRVALANVLTLANTATIFVLIAAGFFIAGPTASAAITGWVIAQNLVAAVALVLVLRHSRSLAADPVPVRDFIAYAIKIGSVNLVSLLNYRADIYIVAAFTSTAALGLYTVAIAGAEALQVLTQVVQQVTTPRIGALETSEAARFVARCTRATLLPVVLLTILAALVIPVLIRLLYGAPFLAAVPALRILLIGVAALYVGSLITNYFSLNLGRPQLSLGVAGVSAAICIVLSLVLVPRVGIVGGAIASSVAYLTGQVIALSVFSKLSSIGIAQTLWPRLTDLASLYEAFRRALVREKPAILVCGVPYFASRTAALLRSRDWNVLLAVDESGPRWLSRLKFLKTLFSAPMVDLIYQLGGPTVSRRLFGLCKFLNRPIVLHWLGSDVSQATDPQVAARVASQYDSGLITNWACAPWLVDELRWRGVGSQWVAPTFVKNSVSSPLPPAPLTILVYLPDERFDFYGGQIVLSLANRFSEMRFVAVGGTGKDRFHPENVEFLGWQSDMNRTYERCHVLLRMAQHDGLSNMVIEALNHGRYAIWNRRHPCVAFATTEEEVAWELLGLQEKLRTQSLPFNWEGHVRVQNEFNEAKVRARIGTALKSAIRK
jgi:O-antigen/teichoic acid export membrane protein